MSKDLVKISISRTIYDRITAHFKGRLSGDAAVKRVLTDFVDMSQIIQSAHQRKELELPSVVPILERLDFVTEIFTQEHFGPAAVGYLWRNLFLPNGTMLKLQHDRKTYSATVTRGNLLYLGEPYSPAGLLAHIAGCDRELDPWQNFIVCRREDHEWRLAAELRQEFGSPDFRRIDRPNYSPPYLKN
jgi:hypothetical protein